ncbi:MAG: hypothetical protein FJW23_11575 [Acidimicrobiia bacterium]|nr:hypothetical protein [Acidimicrobiia bacterium]
MRRIATHRGPLVLGVACALALAGCSAPPQPEAEGPEEGHILVPTPPVPPNYSVNAIMVALVDHSSHELWNAEIEGFQPADDEAWAEIEHHAIQVLGAATLISLGGNGAADMGWAQLPDWPKFSQEMGTAAAGALAAARAKDLEALVEANGALVDSCQHCHDVFKPELPSEGIVHPHKYRR